MRILSLVLAAFICLDSMPAERVESKAPSVKQSTAAVWGGELRFCLQSDPKTFNPILVSESSGEAVRYLTGGVLLRLNRNTQRMEPELAESWKILDGGRKIQFQLRDGVRFSDGSPLSAEDVAFTIRTLMDPNVHSPTGDSLRTGSGPVQISVPTKNRVDISFPAAVAGMERVFDQVAIVSARSLQKSSQPSEMAVLGPYRISDYKPGSYLLLTRNPYYWKLDPSGRRLPYIDSLRLFIQQNRDLEMLRFTRGEIDLINTVSPDLFDQLKARSASSALDNGASLESEFIWFNQVATAPISDHTKEWFRSSVFRRAVSEAINRSDICRVVFKMRAVPAVGPVSPADRFWFNTKLKPHAFEPKAALERLKQSGFRLQNGVLQDRNGKRVEFSIVTNSGNKMRARIAAMVQQDLIKLGITLNIVTLDFPSLIERISRTFNYEACLLGLVNVDLDPSGQMNVLLSSAGDHHWNPSQKKPETTWEAEIDRLMLAQAAEMSPRKRKASFDRVQEIMWEEAPDIFLVNKNSLSAVSDRVKNLAPAILHPQTYWNVERLFLADRVKP